VIRFRANPDGKIDVRFPREKYELREVYNVESTGDVVIDLVPKTARKR
jgi:hypothetical protein